MSRLLPWCCLVIGAFVISPAIAGPQEDQRVRNAVRVLQEILQVPDQAIPDRLIDEARAIVVIPDTLKAGLVLGGRRGQGLISVKTPKGTWSQPAFVKLTGASFGFQAGVQSSDVVLVFRNDRSLDSVVNGQVTLGADVGVAAGPVGRNGAVATDGQLKAEIWSWSRSRGLFAGIALDGAVLHMDHRADLNVYGSGVTPRMIFEGRTEQAPSADVIAFQNALEEASNAVHHRRRPAPATATPSAAGQGATDAPPKPDAASDRPAAPQTSGFQPATDGNVQTEPLHE